MSELTLPEEAKPIAKDGDFVTAKIINLEDPNDSTRQGVLSAGKLFGETGTTYVLSSNAKPPTVVPDQNLWGTTADFVKDKRRELATAKKN